MLEEDDESRDVRVGDGIELRFHKPERPFPDVVDDPVLDFLVTARGRWVSVEVSVRTLDGDGLDAFLAELAEDFRGWTGVRTWRSLERDLTLSARHSGRSVHLTWGMHDRPPSEEWHFEATSAVTA
ncbi:DUF6228 family protein [Actinacidiphila glaucinigra]|uniref:DUF6228 family protein n=1 Tax=Actinacidiphila glaucinigra TaxID=235986 RepID=UPI0035DC6CF7